MDAQEFWLRYCRAEGTPNEMQEQAIEMFLEAMQEVLWQAGRQSGRSTVRKGMIDFLKEAEQFEDRRQPPQFDARHDIDMDDSDRWRLARMLREGNIRAPLDDFLLEELRKWTPPVVRPRQGPGPRFQDRGRTKIFFTPDPPTYKFEHEGKKVDLTEAQLLKIQDEFREATGKAWVSMNESQQRDYIINKMNFPEDGA